MKLLKGSMGLSCERSVLISGIIYCLCLIFKIIPLINFHNSTKATSTQILVAFLGLKGNSNIKTKTPARLLLLEHQ